MVSSVLTAPARVYLLFLAVTAYCITGYAFAARYGEPYPVIIMPGFGDGATKDGRFECEKADVTAHFQNGESSNISIHDLLSGAPDSHHHAIATWMFRGVARAPTSELGTLKRWVYRVLPSRAIRAERHVTGNAPSADSKAWLKARIGQLAPGRMVKSVEFKWYSDIHTEAQGWQRVSRQLAAVYKVEL